MANHAVEEYPTANGPADYALFVKGQLLGKAEGATVKNGIIRRDVAGYIRR